MTFRNMSGMRAAPFAAKLWVAIAAVALFGVAGAVAAPPSLAQSVQRIAAVVGGEAISDYDVDQRMKLFMASSGAKPEGEDLRRLKEQVLRALIDETLQLQEAGRYDVTVSESELNGALEQIAARNSMNPNQIRDVLSREGVRFSTLERQIRAELAWRKLVVRRFGARVRVGDDEVDAVFDRLQAQGGGTQYLVSEVFIAVDSPGDEPTARNTAQGVLDQIREGAPFSAVASQFSQASSAASGGDAGWLDEGALAPELATALKSMSKGQVAGPIRAGGGYYVIGLRDTRTGDQQRGMEPRFVLKQIVVDLPPNADDDAVADAMSEARSASAQLKRCDDVDAIKDDYGAQSGDLGELGLNDLPAEMRAAVVGLSTGGVSVPVRGDDGVHVLMVCERKDSDAARRAKTAIRDRLENQQINLVARRYLRDLRRDAVIEIRKAR